MLWRNDTQKLCKSGGNQFLPRPVVRQAVLPHVQDRPAGTHQAARVPEIRLSYSLPAGTAQQTRRKQILSDLAFRSDFGHTKGRPLCIKMSVPSVELRGFEPLTSSMPWKRATNCANAPKCLNSIYKPGGDSKLTAHLTFIGRARGVGGGKVVCGRGHCGNTKDRTRPVAGTRPGARGWGA